MIRKATDKSRLLGWLTLILVVGFLSTSIAAYVVSSNSIRSGISNDALPLTGDNIYSEIQKDLLQPVLISSLMAHDTFVRDWILGGERNPQRITAYLKEIKEKYGSTSSFLISEGSRKYYFADGVLKTVRQSVPADSWYFRVRQMKAPYEINVDYDLANRNSLTVFINYRIVDRAGQYLGATGVGLTLDRVNTLIDRYQDQFKRRIFFVAPDGQITLTGKSMRQAQGSIHDLPGIREIADRILNRNNTSANLEYRQDGADVLVNARFIPELGWFLVVEQDGNEEIKPVKNVFLLNLAISLAASLLVLAVTLFAVNRYQRRLEQMATSDSLTGLLNRQAFEYVFQKMTADAKRTARPLSVVLFDIDLFKRVNDQYGHLEGDKVIREVADLAREACRASDEVVRWGGEEFMLILKDCPLEHARTLAEKLRLAVVGHAFPLAEKYGQITISLGVVQMDPDESETSLFNRADKALYLAKENGRNRTEG